MAHRKPNRKRRIGRYKPERYNPRGRAERRSVNRKKEKKGGRELKSILYVIAGMALVMAFMIISLHYIRTHEDMK